MKEMGKKEIKDMDDKLKLVLVDDQEDILETLEMKIPEVCKFEIEMFILKSKACEILVQYLKCSIFVLPLRVIDMTK